MALLMAKLLVIAQEQRAAEIADIRGDIVEAAWGNQIRNYVFHPYQMVKDLRTQHETTDVQGVMDGDLDPFIPEPASPVPRRRYSYKDRRTAPRADDMKEKNPQASPRAPLAMRNMVRKGKLRACSTSASPPWASWASSCWWPIWARPHRSPRAPEAFFMEAPPIC